MNAITTSNKSDMTEMDVIIHILSNLLEEYEVAAAELEKDMQSQSTKLAIEDVRRVLDSRFDKEIHCVRRVRAKKGHRLGG